MNFLLAPNYRRAEAADLEEVLAMVAEFHAGEHLAFEAARERGLLQTLMDDDSKGRLWLICRGETPVGYALLGFGYSIEYGGRDGFLDELYVREAYRGQGIGTQTLEYIASECRALGLRCLHLEVDHANARARQLYEKMGYAAHPRDLMTRWLTEKDSPVTDEAQGNEG